VSRGDMCAYLHAYTSDHTLQAYIDYRCQIFVIIRCELSARFNLPIYTELSLSVGIAQISDR